MEFDANTALRILFEMNAEITVTNRLILDGLAELKHSGDKESFFLQQMATRDKVNKMKMELIDRVYADHGVIDRESIGLGKVDHSIPKKEGQSDSPDEANP